MSRFPTKLPAEKLSAAVALLICCAASGVAQRAVRKPGPSRIPRFEDYRVSGVGKGRGRGYGIERPTEKESGASLDRRLRRAASEGANFAGRYAIVGWSCGCICVSLRVVDVRTGRIYRVPFAGVGDGPCPLGFYVGGRKLLEFRRDSRLLIVRGTVEGVGSGDDRADFPCATRYYVWRRNRLALLREIPAG
ncbi:MAG TPA: hypothetical protein VIP46_13685 [Pyrinomonadaceae bacterium]